MMVSSECIILIFWGGGLRLVDGYELKKSL